MTFGDELARIALSEVEGEGDTAKFQYEDRLGRQWEGVVMRRDGDLIAFRNVCPHLGLALDCQDGGFADEQREDAIQCDAHGARFRVEDGRCVEGPCPGETLEMLNVESVEDEQTVAVYRERPFSI